MYVLVCKLPASLAGESLLSTGKHFQLCGDPIHESRIRLNYRYLIGTQESVHRQHHITNYNASVD
jgi:hypothetical protein